MPASPPQRSATARASLTDVHRELQELAKRGLSPGQFCRRGFQSLVRGLSGVAGVLRTGLATASIDECFQAESPESRAWEPVIDGAALEIQSSNTPIARLVQGTETTPHWLLGVPLGSGVDANLGVLIIVTHHEAFSDAEAALEGVQGTARALEGLARALSDSKRESVRGEDVDRAVSRAAAYASVAEFAYAVANNLRAKVGADQVGLGVRSGQRIRVLSVSGVDDPNLRSPGTTWMQQAMEECLDQRAPIVVQRDDHWTEEPLSTPHRLHRHWRKTLGGSTVASLPLMDGDVCGAVVSIARPESAPFSSEELGKIEKLINPLGTGLRLLQRADRGLLRHGAATFASFTRWLGSPKSIVRKLVLLAILAGLGWFAFGSSAYEIAGQGTVVPVAKRHHTAPFDGRIQEVFVRSGDRVEEGELLARMEPGDLKVQQSQLKAELASLDVEIRAALGAGKRADARLMTSKRKVTELRLLGVDRQLLHMDVRATTAGTIVEGDIQDRSGQVVAQGEPLCVLAPSTGHSLEITIPENRVDDVRSGATVLFASHARPEHPLRYRITEIRPVAAQKHLENVFIAVAVLEPGQETAFLRLGMEGVARILAGRRPPWWLALQPVIERLQLRFFL